MTQAMLMSQVEAVDAGVGGFVVGIGLLLIVGLLLWVLAGQAEESEP